MDLRDKDAIITGGASGIGAATAREFARLGAVVVVADNNGDGAREVADGIGGMAIACDVGDEADVNALVRDAETANGPVDVFFSNAGIATGGYPLDTDIDTWNEQWQVNVMAHVFAVRAVLPTMLERESGYLVHTASIAGILTSHANLTYAVTKHAVVGLAEWLSITYHNREFGCPCWHHWACEPRCSGLRRRPSSATRQDPSRNPRKWPAWCPMPCSRNAS